MNVSLLHSFQSLNYFQQLSYFYFIFSWPRETASVTAKRANSDLPQGATAAVVNVHAEQLERSFTSRGRKNNKIVTATLTVATLIVKDNCLNMKISRGKNG